MLHLRHSFTEQSVGELFNVCLNVKFSPIQAALHQNGMRDTLPRPTYQLKDWILVVCGQVCCVDVSERRFES